MTEQEFIAAGGDPHNNGTYVLDGSGMLTKRPAFVVMYDGKTAEDMFIEAKRKYAAGVAHEPKTHVKTYRFL